MAKSSLLPDYQDLMQKIKDKKRYREKLVLIDSDNPHAIPREEWADNVDFWPAITYIHVGLYLLFTPSLCTREDLQITAAMVNSLLVGLEKCS